MEHLMDVGGEVRRSPSDDPRILRESSAEVVVELHDLLKEQKGEFSDYGCIR